MPKIKRVARIVIVPALGVVLMTAGGGCGNGPDPLAPEVGERRKQARLDAFGKAGIDTSRRTGTRDLSGQGAARQRAQGNR